MKTIKIGIDPGVNTGLCAVIDGRIEEIKTLSLHRALNRVDEWIDIARDAGAALTVRVEDARQRKWFGGTDERQKKSGAGVREGIGSVKRDCKIWEEFLDDFGIDSEFVAPKKNQTKLSRDVFEKITGYKGMSSEHSRDAAMLVWSKS